MATEYFETVSVDEALKAAETSKGRVILVVDDEPVIADTLATILNGSGFSAFAAYSGESALEMISARVPDLLITDVCMPGMNGIELAIAVRERFPGCKVLLFSGHASSTDVIDQVRARGYDFEFLSKPVHPRDLLERLREDAA
jgi:DNA-binding NtrC family response regulator